jgi:hypothetical protein
MSQSDLKVLEMERQLRMLQEQVRQLSTHVQFLDRERARTKSELSQVIQEVRTRR